MIDKQFGYLKRGFFRLRRAGIRPQCRRLCGSRKPEANRSENSHSARHSAFNALRRFVSARIVHMHTSKRPTLVGGEPCEFSISTVDAMSAGHITANVHIGD